MFENYVKALDRLITVLMNWDIKPNFINYAVSKEIGSSLFFQICIFPVKINLMIGIRVII